MREAGIIDVTDCMARPDSYDAIIDVRSPAEYALDHLPGAINLPVLDDAQRAIVGTLHAQDSAFVARRVGAALVSRNIATILSDQLGDKPANWRPVIYCWRGGNRSMSLATVLARIGWPTAVIDGGYRSYRRWVVSAIETSAPTLQWHVIS